ncbi:hypothetical protein JKF63_07501 [Porcisia hertigi]|uniref:Integral membrane bound transporter domain-containing protein n=1 Tax=Porcisia hertigi TaxID=2761500 RepID=A0A836LF13_9TRYP|nr:hypothetical protein JKF63_07501 [Porcisia hertigi]
MFLGQASPSSRACRGTGESSSGSDDDDERGTQQGGKGASGCGADGGKGWRSSDGGEGEGLLPTPETPESMVRPSGSKTSGWASFASLRMRNMDALRAYSWDRRIFLPHGDGITGAILELLASPRIWEKVDWAIRGSAISILPTLIVCLEPATAHIFPMPTSVVFLAYCTTQPTLGAGLRETFTVLKAFIVSLAFLSVVVWIQPGPKWLTILILFFSLSIGAFAAQQMRVMIAYCFASLIMQYIAHPESTGYKYIGDYYLTLFIGQGFAVGALMFPFIRWSSENARRYLAVMGDAISLSVHAGCCSFWVEGSLLERQLHVARLRQLRQTIEASMEKARMGLSEMGYEPHTGVYTTRLKTRMTFLKNVFNVVQSMTLVVEQIAANPLLIETPMCRAFGERIRGEMSVAAAAMDAMLLRIVDLDHLVSAADMEAFRAAKARYEDAVSSARDEVILSNENYRADSSDILLGFFLFSVEEMMELISGFQDAAHSPSNLWYFLTFLKRDLQSLWSAFVELYSAITLRHSITRRLKEGIKLSLSIVLAACFQTYGLESSVMNPVIGVETIALLYRSTRGESFQYGQSRLLGTVLGCLTGLVGVQLANGRRPVLYVCTLVLTFIGSYVRTSPDCGAIGKGMSTGVISVVLEYQNKDRAIARIEQNCFAIIIYFFVTSLVWPVRCQTKVRTGFDGCMRMGREVTDRLLRNLDLPHSVTAVSSDVMELLREMQQKVNQQLQNLTGARLEPTMDSAEFPDMAWRMLLSAQRKLVVTLLMMRHAYATFMSSTFSERAADSSNEKGNASGGAVASAPNISVHWVVLHRISPYTRQLSLLLYEAMEVYLLLMSKVTFVPTSELTRLRLGMMQCYDRIVAVYIETIQHELCESDGDEGGGKVGSGEDMSDPLGRRAGLAGQATATAGPRLSVFTPSGLMVDAGVQEHKSTADSAADAKSHPDPPLRRKSATLSRSFHSQRRQSVNGGCRIAYTLTSEERQRLRDYVLSQQADSVLNASFLPSAADMVARRDVDGASGAAGNAVGGASFVNNSIFSLNGNSFCRNTSMWDSALLNSSRIVVHLPVHEEPKRRQGGGTASVGFSTHHSTLHSSHPSGIRGLHSSIVGADDVAVDDAVSAEAAAVASPVNAVCANPSLGSEAYSRAGVCAPPSLGHSSASVASLGCDGPRGRRHERTQSSVSESLRGVPLAAVAGTAAAAAPNAKEVAAPLHSALPHYTVVPTSFAAAATPPSTDGAAANTQNASSGSPSRCSHACVGIADEAVPNHSILLRNSGMFPLAPTGDVGIAGGDVFSLGRRARASPWPPLGLMGSSFLTHQRRGGGATTEAWADGVCDVSLSPPPGTETTPPHGQRALGDGGRGLKGSQELPLSAVAEDYACAEERRGAVLSGATGSEGDRQGAGKAMGAPLSHRSNDLCGTKDTLASCTALPLSPAASPIPSAAAAAGDATAGKRTAGSGVNPPPTSVVANGSFNRLGPAIPVALCAYVEGLAVHQQQQAPPPPALLGNASFIALSSNLPVMSRSFFGGAAADAEGSGRAGMTPPLPSVVVPSASFRGGAPSASASVLIGAAPPRGTGGTWTLEDTGMRGTGVNNSSSNMGNAVELLRSFAGTQIPNTTLLRLLQPDDDVGGEDNKSEYVLANSDIHSLEAFLFGLRALITQMEEIERYLLEVVHGMEMAKKL